MDKLKSVLDYMKKYGFWFLIGLIVLMVLGSWWMATNSVAADVRTKREKIEKTIKDVEAVASTSAHPNQKYVEAIEAEHKKLNDKVLAAWTALYEEQQKNNTWPDVLGKEFLGMIRDLKPNEEIPSLYRGRYWNFIKGYFPTLKKQVDWRHPSEEAAADVAANPAAADAKQVEMVGIVDWDQADLMRLEGKFDSWKTTPSDLAVKLAQEDLWVIQSLLSVIKNTNGNVTEHSKAAIKHIEALDIGASAVAAWGAAEGKVYTGGTPPPGRELSGGSGATAPGEDVLLKQNRYVDEKGEPLSADAAAPSSEFKRMPIRMKLYIDQRKIAKLLVECANSAMPIEIRLVRIKPDEGTPVDIGGASGAGGTAPPMGGMGGPPPGYGGGRTGAPGYGPGMFGGPGGRGGGPGMPPGYGPGMQGYGPGMRGGPGMPQMPGSAAGFEKDALDIPVEIQGIICIYNPPDVNKLGKGAANETSPADSTTDAAATPGAPPAKTDTPAATGDNTAPQAGPSAAPQDSPATTQPSPSDEQPADKPSETQPAAPTGEPAKPE